MLFAMFLPIFTDMLLNNFIGTVHAYFIAGSGEAAISAISLVNQVKELISTIFFSACNATMVIVARKRGSGKHEDAIICSGQTMFFAIYGTSAIAVIFSLFPSQIMTLFFGKMDPIILSEAIKYIPLLGVSLPFYCMFQVSATTSRAFDNHRIPLIISVSGSLVNVFLAFLLITVFKLGIIGAGISLILSNIASGFFGYAFLRKLGWIAPLRDCIFVKFKNIKDVLSLGLYNSIASVITVYASTVKTGFLVPFGISHISASSIYGSFGSLLNVPVSVISTIVSTLVARNLALGEKPRALIMIKKCLAYSISLSVVVYAFAVIILPFVFPSYTDNPLTLNLLWKILILTTLFYPLFISLTSIFAVTFNAAGDARFSTIVNIGCMVVLNLGVGYIFITVFNLGIIGSFLSDILSAIIKSVIYIIRYKSGRWIKIKT
ncbi:MAG: polysaccharide biosynthesis C-terminal domain-containing protein [Clostridia bacterium]|nr:polysaccharide biosynthesis C-terminal domain-containing protein [Clostridia bacterium]